MKEECERPLLLLLPRDCVPHLRLLESAEKAEEDEETDQKSQALSPSSILQITHSPFAFCVRALSVRHLHPPVSLRLSEDENALPPSKRSARSS